ncbi:MAG: orotate phosphoribosyltransferase [Nitriliruptoraceae bacterium]
MSTVIRRPVDPGPFIEFLWASSVVSFGDFVTKSGRMTPYFIDAGRYRTGTQFARLGQFYAEVIAQTFGTAADVVFGPAYKGIPLAVATGIALAATHDHDIGVCFDRKEAKDHGEGGALIGHRPQDGDRIVIVEDVTTAGTSIRTTVPLLRAAADVEIIGIVVGVDRQEQGSVPNIGALDELAQTLDVTTIALATIDDVVAHVAATDQLTDDDLRRIADYRQTYGPQHV